MTSAAPTPAFSNKAELCSWHRGQVEFHEAEARAFDTLADRAKGSTAGHHRKTAQDHRGLAGLHRAAVQILEGENI